MDNRRQLGRFASSAMVRSIAAATRAAAAGLSFSM
jgi:hypothetical protein